MTLTLDSKGKFFTDIIAKDPTKVTIQTAEGLIVGEVHVRRGIRFKDELNSTESFLAVTNARILYNDNKEIFKTSFLLVRCDKIIWISPNENSDAESVL